MDDFEKVRRSVLGKLGEMAARFAEDGTDRADRIRSAIAEIDGCGGFADPWQAVAIHSLVWHVMDGLDPAAHASARAKHAAAASVVGKHALRLYARELAATTVGARSRAAVVRSILPELTRRRDALRAQGYSVPSLTTYRALRTVADWIRDMTPAR